MCLFIELPLGNTSEYAMKASKRGHSFSTCTRFSKKVTFLIPLIRTCSVRNVSFSESFAHVLNE